MNGKKRGLALIYDPNNLHQFIWYYSAHGREYEWTALCLPNGFKGEYMSEYCEKTGIFKNIIRDGKEYLSMSLFQKMCIFLQMLVYAIVGKQELYCKKIVEQYISIDDFDLAVVLTDAGIVSGAFIGLGKQKDVVILEDGMGDYVERSKTYILKHLKEVHAWEGFLLARMGYASPGHVNPLKSTTYCMKYSNHPETMKYRDYKFIGRLFEGDKEVMDGYRAILKKVYSEIEEIDFDVADVVVFTDRLEDMSSNAEKYIKRFEDYVNTHYDNIILKRHPRDERKYKFSVEVQEINSSIPAEVLLANLQEKEILFIYASSVLLYVNRYQLKTTCLYFDGLHEENDLAGRYMDKTEMIDFLNQFELENNTMLTI